MDWSPSLKPFDWTPGQQFEIVAVSINPRETSELAARKKAAYLRPMVDQKPPRDGIF